MSSARAAGFAPLALFALAALLFGSTVTRPIDVHGLWREADLAAVARNFHREGMNPLTPRVDWRGDGPGTVEMEAPLLPWLMAASYPWLGEQPLVGRWLSLAASLAALGVFWRLANHRLARFGATVALAFYAVNPLAVRTAPEIRPEPFMLLALLTAVLHFTRWLRDGKTRNYTIALLATAIAVLVKLPALHLGLLFAPLVLRARGAAALRDPRLWTFAVLALAPAAAWYAHARGIWLDTGLSLGLSNQDHLFGLDLLANPDPIEDALETHETFVYTLCGELAIGLALVLGAWRRWLELELWWAAGLLFYFVFTSATTGEEWATYYHVVAVPCAALLVGGAAERFAAALRTDGLRRWGAGVGALLVIGAFLQSGARTHAVLVDRGAFGEALGPRPPRTLYDCAQSFSRFVEPGTPLLVSGGQCHDYDGRRISHHRPYFLYWLDTRGYQPCHEDHSVETVSRFADLGIRFYLAEKRNLVKQPRYEAELRSTWPVVDECKGAVLFGLR